VPLRPAEGGCEIGRAAVTLLRSGPTDAHIVGRRAHRGVWEIFRKRPRRFHASATRIVRGAAARAGQTSHHAQDNGGHETEGHRDGQDLQSCLEFHPALLTVGIRNGGSSFNDRSI
jgi:hypothetical protein